MKLRHACKAITAAIILATSANGAVTLTSRNFSSNSIGVPIVDNVGTSLVLGNYFWSAGIFSTGFDFSNKTYSQILGAFTAVPSASLGGHATLEGLFNAAQSPDFGTSAAPNATFVGKDAFVLVGNNSTLASSTAVAVFNAGAVYVTPGATGLGSQTLDVTTTGKVVYGTLTSVTVQPNPGTSTYAQGVQMIATNIVPEPSAALLGALGALGLLRRRRI